MFLIAFDFDNDKKLKQLDIDKINAKSRKIAEESEYIKSKANAEDRFESRQQNYRRIEEAERAIRDNETLKFTNLQLEEKIKELEAISEDSVEKEEENTNEVQDTKE